MYPPFLDLFAAGDADVVTHSHDAVQRDTGQIPDSDMAHMFDFEGYHGEQAPYANCSKQELIYPNQQHPVSSHERSLSIGRSDEPEDDSDSGDGWQALCESALADYHSEDPLKDHFLLPQPLTGDKDLIDPPGSTGTTSLLQIPGPEKWDVDRASMEYLASALALTLPCGSLSMQCGIRLPFRDVKIEEPVLQSDPATDMLRLRERNVVRLGPNRIVLLPPNERYDQELQWSSTSLELPLGMDKQLASEKLNVNSETGHFLKAIFENVKRGLETSMSKDRILKGSTRPITPPLLPLSPPSSPERMTSPAAQLAYTSTPEDPLVREGEDLETQIMTGEDIMEEAPVSSCSADGYSPLKCLVGGTFCSPLRRKLSKISDLRISSPLMPVEADVPSSKKAKTVSFAEDLDYLIPRRDSDGVSTDPFDAADEALAAVSAMFEPIARPALDQASNERLVESDTTVRISVPHIEEIEPTTPWEPYSGRHSALLGDINREILKAERKWSGASSLERLLRWCPFPAHVSKPKSDEDFDDDSLSRYLAELDIEDKAGLETMVWKSDALRILNLDEDDELGVSDCSPPIGDPGRNQSPQRLHVASVTTQALTRSLHFQPALRQQGMDQRKRAGKAASSALATQFRATPGNPLVATPCRGDPQVSSMQALLEKRKQQLQREKATLDAELLTNVSPPELMGGEASKSKHMGASVDVGTLSGFMLMQGVVDITPKDVLVAKESEANDENTSPYAIPILPRARIKVSAPHVTTSKLMLPIVVSSAVMVGRSLLKKLQQRLPTLSLVERESTSTNSKQVEPSPIREADLTLSPCTGLMFTTLQKLKQKPLPGQESCFVGVRDQVAQVAPRYERLIILLSEGSRCTEEAQVSIRTLDERDSTAITDLIGFFSRLDTEVQVCYIPGGEDELVEWIAAAVTRYAPGIEGFSLLEDETVWERFLRKAGMNVFAAQVVLDRLKPLSSQSDKLGCFGLPAFVKMDVEERVKRFGTLMGGQNMLRRVSAAIDGLWKVLNGEDR